MVESLLFIIFLLEAVIIFLICKLIDRLSEINFNLEHSCFSGDTLENIDGRNPSVLETLELRKVISEDENTINQLRKENKKLKQFKKGYKTLQKNNSKLQEEVDCLRKQLCRYAKNSEIEVEDGNDENDTWSRFRSVIYE